MRGNPHVRFIGGGRAAMSFPYPNESMDNFLELHRQAIAAGGLLLGKAITARMSRRASRDSGQGYYAVEFEVTGDGTYGDAITRFRQETAVEGIYRALSQPEPHASADADAKAA